ncbi:hypothetical protein HK100_002389, partial [Physocladia obscura]
MQKKKNNHNNSSKDIDKDAESAAVDPQPINYNASYSDSIIRLCSFSSVHEFWAGYSHLKRPHELPTATDLFLFKEGKKPTWE